MWITMGRSISTPRLSRSSPKVVMSFSVTRAIEAHYPRVVKLSSALFGKTNRVFSVVLGWYHDVYHDVRLIFNEKALNFYEETNLPIGYHWPRRALARPQLSRPDHSV